MTCRRSRVRRASLLLIYNPLVYQPACSSQSTVHTAIFRLPMTLLASNASCVVLFAASHKHHISSRSFLFVPISPREFVQILIVSEPMRRPYHTDLFQQQFLIPSSSDLHGLGIPCCSQMPPHPSPPNKSSRLTPVPGVSPVRVPMLVFPI